MMIDMPQQCVLPDLEDIRGLIEDSTVGGVVGRGGGDDVVDTRPAHETHRVPGPAVKMSKVMVGESAVLQDTAAPITAVKLTIYLHSILAIVEAPTEA